MRGGNWSSLLQLVISFLNIIWLSWNAMAVISVSVSKGRSKGFSRLSSSFLLIFLFLDFLQFHVTHALLWEMSPYCWGFWHCICSSVIVASLKQPTQEPHCLGCLYTDIPIWHRRDRLKKLTGNTVMINARRTLTTGLQMCMMQTQDFTVAKADFGP